MSEGAATALQVGRDAGRDAGRRRGLAPGGQRGLVRGRRSWLASSCHPSCGRTTGSSCSSRRPSSCSAGIGGRPSSPSRVGCRGSASPLPFIVALLAPLVVDRLPTPARPSLVSRPAWTRESRPAAAATGASLSAVQAIPKARSLIRARAAPCWWRRGRPRSSVPASSSWPSSSTSSQSQLQRRPRRLPLSRRRVPAWSDVAPRGSRCRRQRGHRQPRLRAVRAVPRDPARAARRRCRAADSGHLAADRQRRVGGGGCRTCLDPRGAHRRAAPLAIGWPWPCCSGSPRRSGGSPRAAASGTRAISSRRP